MFNRACLVVVLLTVPVLAAGMVKSGPQAGDKVPGPFLPLNINGPEAGKKACLYCRNSSHPVAMIFAREISPGLVNLLRRLDVATAAHEDSEMGSCAVICSDAAGQADQLAQLVRQQNLNHLVVAVMEAAGPSRYNLSPEADVTVLLYTHRTVKANYAFRRGELTEMAIDKVVADLPLILTQE